MVLRGVQTHEGRCSHSHEHQAIIMSMRRSHRQCEALTSKATPCQLQYVVLWLRCTARVNGHGNGQLLFASLVTFWHPLTTLSFSVEGCSHVLPLLSQCMVVGVSPEFALDECLIVSNASLQHQDLHGVHAAEETMMRTLSAIVNCTPLLLLLPPFTGTSKGIVALTRPTLAERGASLLQSLFSCICRL